MDQPPVHGITARINAKADNGGICWALLDDVEWRGHSRAVGSREGSYQQHGCGLWCTCVVRVNVIRGVGEYLHPPYEAVPLTKS